VVLIAVLALSLVARSTFARLGEGTSGNTFAERTNAWRYGLKAWAETPVLGVGAGSYVDTQISQGQRDLAAHNTVVSVLVENGLIGFTLYFAFWGIVIRRAMLLPKADRNFWLSVLACYLPAFLSGSAEYQKSLWLLGAMVLCQTPQPRAADAKQQGIAARGGRGPSLFPPHARPS
jgi:O-antigen ligase